jgi:hypothetical protein
LFIDRSPLVFRHILAHLCNEPVPIDHLSDKKREVLELDARFYELDELQQLLGCEEDDSDFDDGKQSFKPVDPPSNSSVLVQHVVNVENLARRVQFQNAADRAAFAKKKLSMSRLRTKIESTVSNEKIKLLLRQDDARFCTTLRTLTSQSGMLSAKFGSGMWKGDQDSEGKRVY